MMSVAIRDGDKIITVAKGAPDVLIKKCSDIILNGTKSPLTSARREKILSLNASLAERALRVIAVATGETNGGKIIETGLTFCGLIGMEDPPREEAYEAVKTCRRAGITPVMITGDHAGTACATAKKLGILSRSGECLTGAQIDKMGENEFARAVRSCRVYARVTPEHKVRIVKALRAHGEVVAMTGDGVNDAPALKAADIGCAMGKGGTQVAQNAADMILTDDNFATIVKAVAQGRGIYDNIRRAVKFLLGSNMSEVLSIFAATMLGFTILEPVHLLWINLLTDCFPALALGMERAEPNVMSRPPRSARESIFAHGVGFDCVYQGVMCAVLTLAAFFIGHYMEYGVWTVTNSPDGTTMAFLTLSMAEIFHSFNMRAHRASIFTLRTPNWTLVGAAAASLALTTLCIYVPFLADAFDFTAISAAEYAVAMGLAVLVIPVVELVKCVQRAVEKRAGRA